MWRAGQRFAADEQGAVAATYAIALVGLIAIAGVGFDYGRLVAMDTELQNGADQAALAGASQLDRQAAVGLTPGACARAAAAARTLVSNISLLASDGTSNAITLANEPACDAVGNIMFWQDRDKTTAATSDANARFIEVRVDVRAAQYVFTPIVGAFNSGRIAAGAMAGIGTAICRTPPVMMCNPAEPASNTDTMLEFPANNYKGVGLRLVANDSYTPGSFGFLETGFGSGANNLLAALGWNIPPGDCVATDGVVVKNGMNASVLDGIRSRFDVPGNGQYCPTIGGVAGECSPSVNVRKDLVRGNNCNNANAWSENASDSSNYLTRNYRPDTATALPSTTTPEVMGHPRDLCHAHSNAGSCNSYNGGLGDRLGTGDWDINAYWRANYSGTSYGGQVSTSYGPQPKGYPTRYEVYRWEADHIVANDGLVPTIKNAQGSTKAYAQPQANTCLATASSPYGLVPSAGVDRRRITVAVLNCNALQAKYGNSLNNQVLEVGHRNWVDVFLVEPPYARSKCTSGSGCSTKYSEGTDVYAEVIEPTAIAGGSTLAQTLRRDVPYLVR